MLLFFQAVFASADNEALFKCSFEREGDLADSMCHEDYRYTYSRSQSGDIYEDFKLSDPGNASLQPYDGNRYAFVTDSSLMDKTQATDA